MKIKNWVWVLILVIVCVVSYSIAVIAFGATAKYKVVSGDTWESLAVKNNVTLQQLVDLNQPLVGASLNVPVVVTPPTTDEIRFTAYTTGYGYPDNTPKNSAAICCGVLHKTAGGTGTYSDPITIAVGHSISGSIDTLDYPAGTKFYIPNFRRYFIVEDACGDGSKPQNGPCHTGFQGNPWLDIWVGGVGFSASPTIACENAITNTHLVIQNPSATYPVVSGQIYNGSCTVQYGDVI